MWYKTVKPVQFTYKPTQYTAETHPAATAVVVWMSYVAFTDYATPYMVLPVTVISPAQELKLNTHSGYSPSPPLMKC